MIRPVIRRFVESEAHAASRWVYEPPYDLYNGNPRDEALFLDVTDDGYGYYAIVDRDNGAELIGFCCFGPEARVIGQMEEPDTVDVGGGIRPDLAGQGIGTFFFPAVLQFAHQQYSVDRFRTAVAEFNERSIRLCRSAGFRVARSFEDPGGRQFYELVREGL